MNQAEVSVVIPVYNGERYLAEAIESVMAQSYPPIEIIIVDDGSMDRSASIAKGFGSLIRYFFQPNTGTAEARNHGIRRAKGNLFAFLDQDDLWLKDKLRQQVAAFSEDPLLEVVFGKVKPFLSFEMEETLRKRIHCPAAPLSGYTPSAMLIKQEAFSRVGFFETKWRIGEWADWYVRSVELSLKTKMLPSVILLRRLHAANKSLLQRDARREYARILKLSINRHRQRARIPFVDSEWF